MVCTLKGYSFLKPSQKSLVRDVAIDAMRKRRGSNATAMEYSAWTDLERLVASYTFNLPKFLAKKPR